MAAHPSATQRYTRQRHKGTPHQRSRVPGQGANGEGKIAQVAAGRQETTAAHLMRHRSAPRLDLRRVERADTHGHLDVLRGWRHGCGGKWRVGVVASGRPFASREHRHPPLTLLNWQAPLPQHRAPTPSSLGPRRRLCVWLCLRPERGHGFSVGPAWLGHAGTAHASQAFRQRFLRSCVGWTGSVAQQ